MPEDRTYIAIDLKSFYASVECVDRGLDPLGVNLVVADPTRTEKTICLAVSPSLKACGVSGRARLFEVIQRVGQLNYQRRRKLGRRGFSGKSWVDSELKADPSLEIDFITAPPRMSRYMQVSAQIYSIYLRYIAPEDIHVYSVDEVFIDATAYLRMYKLDGRGLAIKLVREVLAETGITATAGIGTNMYLCKVAMDIVAKHMPADKDGVRIAELDEKSYRKQLWSHTPITDFWRIGKGYARRLAEYDIHTMGDVARCSLGGKYDRWNQALLFRLFGVNAELLIDHAWGWEPCTIAEIKAYRPANRSLSSGQVLHRAYEPDMGQLIVREMADLLALDLVAKDLVANQVVLTVGYDRDNMKSPERLSLYQGEFSTDHYGRVVPRQAHGSLNLGRYTSSSKLIIDAVTQLYDRIADPNLLIRRVYVVANHVIPESKKPAEAPLQLDFFSDYETVIRQKEQEEESLRREHSLQQAMLNIKRRYGKNAILRGMNLKEGAMTIQRNGQVGGHKA